MPVATAPLTLYLSKLTPSLRSRRARVDLADPYEMHRTIMAGFPALDRERPEHRVLWRLELPHDNPGRELRVLVQSAAQPDWFALDGQRRDRFPDDSCWFTNSPPAARSFEPAFREGQYLRFRLRANPTKRLHKKSRDELGQPIDPKWIGKRVELRRPDEQMDWLGRHAQRCGFQLLQVVPRPERDGPVFGVVDRPEGKRISHKQTRGDDEVGMTHFVASFEGVLSVTDPPAFCNALATGIGPAKAFGFGLLSVAPVR